MAYNGWANRETWNVALWLGNDEGLYRAAREFARSTKGKILARDARKFVEGVMPNGTPDFDSAAEYKQVRWGEIAGSLTEYR